MLIVDLPFSAVFDTVVMPYDLYRIYSPNYSEEKNSNHRDNPQRDKVR